MDRLETLRARIQELDREIVALVEARLTVARQIGERKLEEGIPVRNYAMEAVVHQRYAEACRERGLDPSLGRDLAAFLIDRAVEEQAALMDTVYSGDALDAVVVGGRGGMGSWMARFLANQGHRVRVCDPSDVPSPFGACTLEEARSAELIVVAVPMDVCRSVLEQLRGATGIVAELCSLKGFLGLDELRAQGMRLVSFHPMFGPSVRTLHGRVVAFCREGEDADRAVVRELFEQTTAELVELDTADHDRRMAVVLGMTHLSNLALAVAIGRSGIDGAALAEVAGTTFRKQLATTREVCAENPSLYFQIQRLNAATPDTAVWLRSAVAELAGAVEAGDAAVFEALMRDGQRAIGG